MVDYPEYKPDGSFERYMKKLNEFGTGSIFSLLLLVFGVVIAVYGLWKDNEGYVGYDDYIFLGMMIVLMSLTTATVMKLR
tara:strand:+ start:1829 stop:2068 length:240 start_codon:yes stop_codon:yes gene_type:complete